MDKIIVIGLPRSGTTYLKVLLFTNFQVIAERIPEVDKHSLFNDAVSDYFKRNRIIVFLIRKPVDIWIESIHKLHWSLNLVYPGFKEIDNNTLPDFHFDFYKQWETGLKKSKIPYLFIEYIDLIYDFEMILAEIQLQFRFQNKNMVFQNVNKVHNSEIFTENVRINYLKKAGVI